jgi:hypothetical protein
MDGWILEAVDVSFASCAGSVMGGADQRRAADDVWSKTGRTDRSGRNCAGGCTGVERCRLGDLVNEPPARHMQEFGL